MWTLIIIGWLNISALEINHIDGFQSQQACIEASRIVAKTEFGTTQSLALRMHCVYKGRTVNDY